MQSINNQYRKKNGTNETIYRAGIERHREWTCGCSGGKERVGQIERVALDWGFPGGSDGKEFAHEARDPASIPGSGRSPGEGNGYPLQYSCLENCINRGAWWAKIHGVAKSWA